MTKIILFFVSRLLLLITYRDEDGKPRYNFPDRQMEKISQRPRTVARL